MRKSLIITLFAIITLSISSCIELEEALIVHSDLSGKLSYSLGINKASGLLGLISGLADKSFESQLKEEVLVWVSLLQKQPGISDVQYNIDPKKGDYYLSFEFNDQRHLNKALYEMTGNRKTFFSPSYLKIKKHRVKKFNISPYVKKYLKRESLEIDPSFNSYITYISTIHTPTSTKSVSAGNFSLNTDKTIVSQRFEIADVLNNHVSTGIVIKY